MQKPSTHYFIIDASCLGYASFFSKSSENNTDNKDQTVKRFLIKLRSFLKKFPESIPVVVWDGNAKWRVDLFKGYKKRRSTNPKILANKLAYKKHVPSIQKTLETLGIIQLFCEESEADDVACKTLYKLKQLDPDCRITFLSADSDWLQFVIDPEVRVLDQRTHSIITVKNFKEVTGFDNYQHFVFGKIVQGDSGDTIPGIPFLEKDENFQKIKENPDIFKKALEGQSLLGAAKVDQTLFKYACESRSKKIYARNKQLIDLVHSLDKCKDIKILEGTWNESEFFKILTELDMKKELRNKDEFLTPFLQDSLFLENALQNFYSFCERLDHEIDN